MLVLAPPTLANNVHTTDIEKYQHSHDFGVTSKRSERRTWFVVALTGLTMVVELFVGYLAGSMALIADGWHMATHMGALSIAGFAYWYARKQSGSGKFTFGPGKVHALAGYTNAVLLAVVAIAMIWESAIRLRDPISIDYLAAIPVAVIGLVVNIVSMIALSGRHHHGNDLDEDHHHDKHEDHNLRGVFLHVAADALTSVLAIGALATGYLAGWAFLDPVIGIVGALVILKWGWNLMRGASKTLLDATPTNEQEAKIRECIENLDDTRIIDFHLWELAPGHRACIVSLIASDPKPTEFYREKILEVSAPGHLTVEVNHCNSAHTAETAS